MTTNTQTRLTYQHYLDLPETDDRFELIDGELHMAPTPVPEHQLLLGEIYSLIRDFLRENNIGRVIISPQTVILSDDTVVQPDMMFISNARMDIIRWGQYVRGAPDLVVEVLSPSTQRYDRTLKMQLYAAHGVQEYWIADIAARSIEPHTLQDGAFTSLGVHTEGGAFQSPLLQGLTIDIRRLFQNAMI